MDLKVIALALVVIAASVDRSTQQIRVERECNGQMDLIFMLDASNSVLYPNFIAQIETIEQLVKELDIGPDAVRIGMVVFSKDVASFPLTDNKKQILDNIALIRYLDSGTNTHLGLDQAAKLFAQSTRDPNVPKLLLVITDGASAEPQKTIAAAQRAKNAGISIYALGILIDLNMDELYSIASSSQQVMTTPNFDNIKEVIRQAIFKACTFIVIPPPLVVTRQPTLPPTLPPTRPPTRPPTPVTNHICANSGAMSSGMAYVNHPLDCYKYIQCYYKTTDGTYLAVVRHCGAGLHWNQQTQICDDPMNVQCPNDPCKNDCAPYPMADTARGYWVCENGRSKGMCCKEFESFVPGKGCVQNMNCKEPCKIGDCTVGKCSKRPLWNMPGMYQVPLAAGFFGAYSVPCTKNEFDVVSCECSANKDHFCTADFETDLSSTQSLGQFVALNGISPNGASTMLGSSGSVRINPHKTMGDEPVTIKIQFRENFINGQTSEILMASNLDCGTAKGYLLITYSNQFIIAKVTSSTGQETSLSIPTQGITANDIKELTFTYKTGYVAMSLKVGGIQIIEKCTAWAYVWLSCGFDIGSTQRYNGFTGYLQRISVYSCSFNRMY